MEKTNYKYFKIIENYEEFKKAFIECSTYLKKDTPEKQEKTCRYFFNSILLIKTSDNYYIELDKKPKIDARMWYDDETEAPEKSKENFINYNLRLNNRFSNIDSYLEEKKRLEETGGASGAYDYNGIYLEKYNDTSKVYYNILEDKRGEFIRYMTNDEQKEFLQIVKMLQAKYRERLERYFKRYNKNIVTCGYWVNR